MAGYMRIAVKLSLAATAMAALGAGGYYGATSGHWLSALGHAKESQRLTAENQPAAELDAVASAWNQPLPSSPVDSADSYSVAARSASATQANMAPEKLSPASDDRYGIYPGMQASVSTPDADNSVLAQLPIQPAAEAPSSDFQAIRPQSIKSESGEPTLSSTDPSAVVELSQTATVARGQAPREGVEAPNESAMDVVEAKEGTEPLSTASKNGQNAEASPLSSPSNEFPLTTARQRARRAFGDQAPAATAERYRSPVALAAGEAASGGERAAIAASANPFASEGISSIPATSSGTIEALPPIAGDAPSANAMAQPTEHGFQASAQDSARAALNPIASRFADAQREPSAEAPPTSSTEVQPGTAPAPLAKGAADAASIAGTGRPGERALEGPQNSSLVIQKFAPGEIQVGKPAKFIIQIRNAGNQVAEEILVRDEVPQGTRLVSSTPAAEANGNQLVWQIGKLSAGEERSLEIQLMPVAEGEIGSVATVSYSAQASVKTRCTMPQLAVRMSAPEKVLLGHEQRVKIELNNPGTGDATGVMLFENVPQNLKHVAGPALEFEIGTLRAGETRQLELALQAEKAGKVVNQLTARADGNLQVQQQVEFEVIAPALAVAVNGPERRYLERPATYEVGVQNPGTAPAYDVQIVTKLPKGMRFVRANNMGEYDAASHAVYWSLAELPEGERGTVELVAMPVEAGQQTLEVEAHAGQGLTDQAKQQITVEGLAAIMFEVRDLEDPIEVGGETGYEIRVVNQGTKAATNVRVAVHLPAGMQVVSAEGETQYSTQGGVLAFEPLPQLAPKSDSLFRVQVQGVRAGDQRVTVEVNTDELSQPIRREESTRVFGDE